MIQLMSDFVDDNGKLNLRVCSNKAKLLAGDMYPLFYPVYNQKIENGFIIESGFDPDTLGFNVTITEVKPEVKKEPEIKKVEVIKSKFETFKEVCNKIKIYDSKSYIGEDRILEIREYTNRIVLMFKFDYQSFDIDTVNSLNNNDFEKLLKSISVTREMKNYFNGTHMMNNVHIKGY